MANEIQTAPNTTPTTDADWAAELNLRELSMKGYDGISLTEWEEASSDKPEIAAGSVIEIDGAIAKFTSDTALTDEVGLADGWCYIKFVVSGSDVVPTLTNTFGTWDTAKQGFYDGNDRYSLHVMYRTDFIGTKLFMDKTIIPIETGILGYRYYDKIYTGTVAATQISFADGYYNTAEAISSSAAIEFDILGTEYDIVPTAANYFTYGETAGTIAYLNTVGAGYNGDNYRVNIRYKLTL